MYQRMTCVGALLCAACGSDQPMLAIDMGHAMEGDASMESPDAGLPIEDAGLPPCVAPPMRMPTPDTQSMRLSELGLYADITSKQTACDLLTWQPRFPLWSDGATKQRWLRLPEGAKIDSADADHLRFPVGAVLFKEFALAGKRLETRVIARVSQDETFFGAFVWRDDESDADLVRAGANNVRGGEHDVPSETDCLLCHKGEPGRVLGLSAIQTPDFARFSQPVPTLEVAPALGYLHGNCGHCHNEYGDGWRMAEMTLRLSAREGATLLRQSIGAPTTKTILGRTTRIVPGDPDASAVLARMQVRGGDDQMPPIASEHVDPEGLAQVRAWIESVSAE
ncbi:MAG: hypothetical protein ABW352_23360 [Polyangiales bacterium]